MEELHSSNYCHVTFFHTLTNSQALPAGMYKTQRLPYNSLSDVDTLRKVEHVDGMRQLLPWKLNVLITLAKSLD